MSKILQLDPQSEEYEYVMRVFIAGVSWFQDFDSETGDCPFIDAKASQIIASFVTSYDEALCDELGDELGGRLGRFVNRLIDLTLALTVNVDARLNGFTLLATQEDLNRIETNSDAIDAVAVAFRYCELPFQEHPYDPVQALFEGIAFQFSNMCSDLRDGCDDPDQPGPIALMGQFGNDLISLYYMLRSSDRDMREVEEKFAQALGIIMEEEFDAVLGHGFPWETDRQKRFLNFDAILNFSEDDFKFVKPIPEND